MDAFEKNNTWHIYKISQKSVSFEKIIMITGITETVKRTMRTMFLYSNLQINKKRTSRCKLNTSDSISRLNETADDCIAMSTDMYLHFVSFDSTRLVSN